MALVLQEIVDTFAAKVVSKLAFITVGGKKAELEGKGTDKKVTLRIIDPCATVHKDASTVGTNSNAVTLDSLAEKKVEVPMVHYWSAVGAAVIDEAVSIKSPDLQEHLDAEARNMAAQIRKDAVKSATFTSNTAFVGGWEEVMAASGFLGGEVDEDTFGFINYKAKSKLAVSQPFGSQVGEKLYRTSEIGRGNDGSYFYNEKEMPTITIPADHDISAVTATVVSGKLATLVLTSDVASGVLPAGTPITIQGLKACDVDGNVTDEDAVVILNDDVAGDSSGVYTCTGCYDEVLVEGVGRQIADEDGTDAKASDITGASVPAAGTYFTGFLKLRGFNTYASAEVKSKQGEYKTANVDGIVISINSVTDNGKVDIVNAYRFDCYLAQGIVDPRGTTMIFIKK